MPVPTDPILIDDPADPLIADFVGLRDRDLRMRDRRALPEQAVFVAEGDPVVERAVRAGFKLISVLIDATRTEPLPPLVDAAFASGSASVVHAGPEVLRRITGLGVHRGCMGVFERRPEPDIGDLLGSARRILVLEQVVNPINLGVIVRSAAGLGFDGMILDEASVDPFYRRASRVAMGEVFDFPFARSGRFPLGLAALRDHGFTLVALTPAEGAESIDDLRFDPEERVALVLGSEGPGLTDPTMRACDRRVAIPLAGRVDSLNVGAAAAIACYAITRA